MVVGLALLAVALVGASRQGWSRSKAEPIDVQATAVRAVDVHPALTAAGTFISPDETKIASPVGGRLVSLTFIPGQTVKKGDILARLRADTAHAALKAAQARRSNAEQVFMRDEKLLPIGGVSSEQLLNDASLLDAAEARVAQAKEKLAQTEIRAPYSGVLGFRDISVGAFVQAGDPITDIRKMDPLVLQMTLPQIAVGNVRIGLSVEIEVPGVCGVLSGRIVAIGPSLDPVQHSLRVQVQVPNGAGFLKPGMFATAQVMLSDVRRAFFIPEEAVTPEEGSSYIWVARADGTAHRIAVTLGSFRNGDVEVLSGLQPSSTVITAGMQKLRQGSKVKVGRYQPLRNPDLHSDRADCTAGR